MGNIIEMTREWIQMNDYERRVIANNYLIDPGIDGIEDFELIDDE